MSTRADSATATTAAAAASTSTLPDDAADELMGVACDGDGGTEAATLNFTCRRLRGTEGFTSADPTAAAAAAEVVGNA